MAKYRELREKAPMSGSFDSGEWEVNTLAERLGKQGKVKDAILIYELNREFYPQVLHHPSGQPAGDGGWPQGHGAEVVTDLDA